MSPDTRNAGRELAGTRGRGEARTCSRGFDFRMRKLHCFGISYPWAAVLDCGMYISVFAALLFFSTAPQAESFSPIKLKPIHNPPPKYPSELRKNCIQGIVRFYFYVAKDGTVSDVRIIESPDAKLSWVVINTLKDWRYEPIPELPGNASHVETSYISFKVGDDCQSPEDY